VFNALLVLRAAIPPYRPIDLLAILNLCVVFLLLYAIRVEKRTERNIIQRELDRSLGLLQTQWIDDDYGDHPTTWFLADTHASE
jgi:hypothetical protein